MRRRTLLALLPALGAGGCASLVPPQTTALLAQAPQGLPRGFELRDVPFFPQTPHHCGPAALATALGAAGFKAAPDALAQAVFLPAREGTLQVEMLGGARRQGAVAVRLPGTLEALLREVADGHPPVVLLNLGLSMAPMWHYAVLVGYDLGAREVVLRSGTTERQVMPLRTFEHTWARGGHWAFVVTRPGELPRHTTELHAQQAALGFSKAGSAQDNIKVWKSVADRWPNGLLTLMGLGNARMATAEYAEAAEAFERAAKTHDSAAAWNNLAQSALRLGDLERARQAGDRAVDRAQQAEPQWLAAAKSTRDEIRRKSKK